jgi:hypothetical protein
MNVRRTRSGRAALITVVGVGAVTLILLGTSTVARLSLARVEVGAGAHGAGHPSGPNAVSNGEGHERPYGASGIPVEPPTTGPSPSEHPGLPPSDGGGGDQRTPAPVPAKDGIIRLGMEGPVVEDLQRRLNELGFTVAALDGVFGGETLHALVAFQKVNGLGRDGVVGSLTARALEHAAIPAARSAGPGFHVEVDVSRQVLFLVRDGAVTDVYDVSTGTEAPYEYEGREYIAHTPTGSFLVQRKIDGPREAPLGLLYRPAYFDGGYAIHGSPSVPAYPASHGCVRVTDQVMDRIFDLLAIGTPVDIYA